MRADDDPTDADGGTPRPDAAVAELTGADDVARLVERQWGDSLHATGVVHGTSVWRRGSTHVSLRLGPSTPKALHDTLALGVARARADAILTTGRNLRSEPTLTHALPGPRRTAAALAAWRREHLGKATPPVSLVLTSGRDLDLDHPFFTGAHRKVLFTDPHGAHLLESRAVNVGAEIVADPTPTPRGAVDFLRAAFGAATIAIEAGASVARELYGDDPVSSVIDEVMLSIFEGPDLPTAARGARQPPPAELDRRFPHRSRPYRVLAEDGPWAFVRYGR